MIEVGKDQLTGHSNFISGSISYYRCQRQNQACQVVSEIFGMNFVCVFVVRCHVVLLLSSTMLRAGLVDSVSCIVVAVWRPCFMRVLSTVCHVLLLLSGDHASCGSCRQCIMYSGDHA